MRVANKWKAVAAAIGTVVTAVNAALADNLLGFDEVGTLVTAVVTAALTVYAVWRVPNRDEVPAPTEPPVAENQ